MGKFEEEVQQEVESGEFDKYIKTECAWCGHDIPGTIDWYCARGNMCLDCSVIISRAHNGVRLKRIGKGGKEVSYKARDYSQAEIDDMFRHQFEKVRRIKESRLF